MRFLADIAGFMSLATVLMTVASLPWMLGGIVPLARLTLLVGAIVAAALSLLASLLYRRFSPSLPAVILPLAGLVLIGTLHLRSTADATILQMDSRAIGDSQLQYKNVNKPHSLSPADTRTAISTLLALTLLAIVAFERASSQRAIVTGSLLFLANAVVVTVIGMGELFGQDRLALNEIWFLGRSHGKSSFAGFVNPNNAAGWLCLAVSLAAGWVTWHLKPAGTAPKLRHGRLRVSLAGRAWQRSVEKLAELTVWQSLALAGVTFLAAGVAATQSRGGILALLIAAVLTSAMYSSIRSLPIVLLLLSIGGASVFVFLRSFSLDQEVVGELETLNDLTAASQGRIDHWLDSLWAAWDFPLLGTGLGSYRMANLPYQTYDPGVWFRYADNFYIDMLVEGGIAGLMLFLAAGGCGIVTGLASWRQSKVKTISRDEEAPRVSRRFVAACGTTVVLATVTQACTAFFDYGIGLTAASALLIFVIASTAGFLSNNDSSARFRSAGSVRVGVVPAVAVQLCLMGSASAYVLDQVVAVKLDQQIVLGSQLLRPPVEASKLDQVAPVRETLQRQLKQRPDDVEALQLLCQLQEAEFRWNVLQFAHGDAIRHVENLPRMWRDTSLRLLIEELDELRVSDRTKADELQAQIQQRLLRATLPETLGYIRQSYPLLPRLSVMQAAVSLLMDDQATFDKVAASVYFTDPGSASTMFELGALALRADQAQAAEKLWERSLVLSDRFRAAMLATGKDHWEPQVLFEKFGPTGFASCVRAAKQADRAELAKNLWEAAEKRWADVTQPASPEVSLLRLDQLRINRRHDEAEAWLTKSAKNHPENIELIRLHALQLEQSGRFQEALQQWYRLQFLDSGSATATSAISRLMSMEADDRSER